MNREETIIVNRVKDTIKKYNLIEKEERIIAGVSGGPDSICMLSILNVLKKDLGFHLAVATFNHKIRKESGEEAQFVRNVSSKLGILFFYGEKDIKKIAKTQSRSLEDVAREERIAFLLKIKQEKKYDKIALAHTMDDLVETSLIHLLKGTGVTGLIGIKPTSFQGIIHPMLFIERKDVEKYLKLKKIPFRIDLTNFSLNYLRNRIRHQIVPLLTSLNPEIKQHILNLSLTLIEEERFINKISQRDRVVIFNKGKYSITIFNALPLFEKRRIIKLILGKHATFKRIERIIEFLLSKKNKTNLYGNLYIKKDKKEFWVEQPMSSPFSIKKKYPLVVPGETNIREAEIIIKTKIIKKIDKTTLNKNKIVIDMDKVPLPLKIRFRKKGDRINIKRGSKKIQDLLVDEKINKEIRHKIPIVTSKKDEIIWIVGVRRSNLYKITSNTKKKLLLIATLRKKHFMI